MLCLYKPVVTPPDRTTEAIFSPPQNSFSEHFHIKLVYQVERQYKDSRNRTKDLDKYLFWANFTQKFGAEA